MRISKFIKLGKFSSKDEVTILRFQKKLFIII